MKKFSIVRVLGLHTSESAGVRMVGAVKSRPNYYELLGLTPSATADAITRAFARATSAYRPHAFGGITELCIAYETLRDPARRRAYDASLGLTPKPPIPSATRPASAHFMLRPAVAIASPLEPKVQPKIEPKAESKIEPKAEPKPPEPVMRPPVQPDAPMPRQLAYSEVNVGFSPMEWKRAGTIVGGLVAAAVSVGAIAGWWSGSSAAVPDQAPPAPSQATQPEEPLPSFSELWPEPAPRAVAPRPDQSRRAAPIRPRVERTVHRPQLAASEVEAPPIQPPPDLANPSSADPLAPETAPAPAVVASMPLPNRTVARTIDRIGYRCGSVASATPAEGAPGVYKIVCTSGQSFQAKPVNGRYRFRRLAGN